MIIRSLALFKKGFQEKRNRSRVMEFTVSKYAGVGVYELVGVNMFVRYVGMGLVEPH